MPPSHSPLWRCTITLLTAREPVHDGQALVWRGRQEAHAWPLALAPNGAGLPLLALALASTLFAAAVAGEPDCVVPCCSATIEGASESLSSSYSARLATRLLLVAGVSSASCVGV